MTDTELLQQRIESLNVLLVCGSGGVGKTSIAASIAVNEARRGRRVCVLTIDPAKRLADALGLDGLDDRERQVDLGKKKGRRTGGELYALMLDPKRAFDRLVMETAGDPESQDRILHNRIYQNISVSTAGVQEYMALERLFEIDRSGRYDLLVVDTPPSVHARDLLTSPHRMLSFLEGKSLRWFLRPGMKMGRLGLRSIGGSGGPVMSVLQRITGVEMIRDTTEFFEAFEGTYSVIADRIKVVDRMFEDDGTGFLVVTSSRRESMAEAIDFWNLLCERNLGFTGTIVNRAEPPASQGLAKKSDLVDLAKLPGPLATMVRRSHKEHRLRAAHDQMALQRLSSVLDGAPCVAVPRLSHVVTDINGLTELGSYLISAEAKPAKA